MRYAEPASRSRLVPPPFGPTFTADGIHNPFAARLTSGWRAPATARHLEQAARTSVQPTARNIKTATLNRCIVFSPCP